jgi:alpha-glucosidase
MFGNSLFRTVLIVAVLALFAGLAAMAEESVASPDGRIKVTVETGKRLAWSLSVDGVTVVNPSPIALKLYKGDTLGARAKLKSANTAAIDESITPPVAEKRAVITNKCNELRLDFDGDFSLLVRAYDDAAAYRIVTARDGEMIVEDETATFNLAGDYTLHRTTAKTVSTSFESPYTVEPVSQWKPGVLSFMPLLVAADKGLKLIITEADLNAYPGMFLVRDEKGSQQLNGRFAPYPKVEAPSGDRHIKVKAAEPFIAKTTGSRAFPWRVVGVARKDAELIENDVVYRLGTPCALADTSWIKPGKVAWDWWNANNLWDVPFKSGINTETYKYYIDFAAKNGLEYIILDEGWSDTRDLTKLKPEVNLEELIQYGNGKKVKLILWCVWCTLDRQRDEVLPWLEKMGIAGVKVDFMDRDDQVIVEFYERMAKATADHHLLLDFHGSYKPTGLRRTYPNLITREGVAGMEQSKWSSISDPAYTTSIPFIRMFAGPMDYTPGAMRNEQKDVFKPVFNKPSSLGTRCQQLAMYVVFESPLQMLSDSPSAYEREPECTSFIAGCPTTWDETKGVDGKVGEYVVVARRKGDAWWVGAMNNWDAREITVPLSFLGGGSWKADTFADGPGAATTGTDFARSTSTVKPADALTLKLAPGGGYAARFVKE